MQMHSAFCGGSITGGGFAQDFVLSTGGYAYAWLQHYGETPLEHRAIIDGDVATSGYGCARIKRNNWPNVTKLYGTLQTEKESERTRQVQ